MGKIQSDGWAFCAGACHWVTEPVFPYTYNDFDGATTAYYCHECFRAITGRSVEDHNVY